MGWCIYMFREHPTNRGDEGGHEIGYIGHSYTNTKGFFEIFGTEMEFPEDFWNGGKYFLIKRKKLYWCLRKFTQFAKQNQLLAYANKYEADLSEEAKNSIETIYDEDDSFWDLLQLFSLLTQEYLEEGYVRFSG